MGPLVRRYDMHIALLVILAVAFGWTLVARDEAGQGDPIESELPVRWR